MVNDTVGALSRGEPVLVRLPNGMTIEAVPEMIQVQNPQTGQIEDKVQLHVRTDGASGVIEGQLRMSPETFHQSLVKVQNFSPRLALVQERLRLREQNK